VLHCELKIGPARFMLAEERPLRGAFSPLTLGGTGSSASLFSPDVDRVYAAALAAGPITLMPLQDQRWGDRAGHV